ncbi:hypothetical protein DICPUDRAFT_83464 [Dictyostelium purpureum]|uniref:Uncharacterized protein n=1 Tax=Dictyostelium purpureum TaxID=5786 RepID=F0ZZM2_DICPU|nr:uncharacterized protein DICPUDRAFT_83464 [Dictyostelium purpureum]EGC30608.1 hypothetical protein DICPUDRAFT_83464 [Dictyostelium purpureum]|eukprot:XP_003292872.1 hypothetical protein DICPUDRAFT_83464 [Dictyostelium purpureum]
MYDRFKSHDKEGFNHDSILCYMKFKPTNDKKNYQTTLAENKLLNLFVTMLNSKKEGGFDEKSQNAILDKNGLPFDILATFLKMDIYDHANPHEIVNGHETPHITKKPKGSKKDIYNMSEPFFPHGVPYKDGSFLKEKDFDKECEKPEEKPTPTPTPTPKGPKGLSNWQKTRDWFHNFGQGMEAFGNLFRGAGAEGAGAAAAAEGAEGAAAGFGEITADIEADGVGAEGAEGAGGKNDYEPSLI